MSRISYENYGKRARRLADATLASARSTIQTPAQRRFGADGTAKREPRPEEWLLEVGCGVGMLLVPLSYVGAEVTGVDHPSCVQRYGETSTERT